MHYGYMGFSFWDTLGHILIVLLIIWVVLRLVCGPRWSRRWGRGGMGGPGMWQSHNALQILNERYAKGEINKEEYEERKKTLMG